MVILGVGRYISVVILGVGWYMVNGRIVTRLL